MFALVMAWCPPALATAEDDLSAAEAVYYAGQYEDAVFLMEELSRRPGVSREVKLSALKYTAFCYFLLGSKPQAKAAWRRLLDLDPSFRLDSLEDPPRFVEFFNQLDEGDEPAAAPEPVTKRVKVAAPEEPSPRGCGVALCLIPFGVGQMANDNVVKGAIFAGLETLFLGLNIGFYFQNQSELNRNNGAFVDRERANTRSMLQNVFFGMFLTSVAVGIVDAFVFYED